MATRTYTETLDTMYASTREAVLPGVWDQVEKVKPFFLLMTRGDRMKTQVGGTRLEERLRRTQNQTVTSIGPRQSVTIQHPDPLTTSYWAWKYLASHITRSKIEEQQNSGSPKIVDIVASNTEGEINAIKAYQSAALFGDGTGNSSLDPDGLGNIIAVTTTSGTVGGIDRATETWWRNVSTSMSGISVSTNLVPDYMLNMWNTLGLYEGEGRERFPDILVTTQTIAEIYEGEAIELYRITDKEIVDFGFGDLAYKGAPLVWDPDCPTGRMYFVNTKFLRIFRDPGMWMSRGAWIQEANAPDVTIAHSMSAYNMVACNCRKLGVIHTMTTT